VGGPQEAAPGNQLQVRRGQGGLWPGPWVTVAGLGVGTLGDSVKPLGWDLGGQWQAFGLGPRLAVSRLGVETCSGRLGICDVDQCCQALGMGP
jgi:hypothetical protein